MTIPLSVRLKFKQAREHLHTLEELADPFLASQQQKITPQFNLNRTHKEFWIRGPDRPDETWNPIVGDILYNLRSSLDHLAWALIEANGKKGTARTQFPIFRNATDFLCKSPAMIERMSRPARAAIEAAQPYNRSKVLRLNYLWLLNEFSNIDKHRHFNLVVAGQEAASGALPDDAQFYFGPIEGDTCLAVIPLGDKMDVNYTAHLGVAFGEALVPSGGFEFFFGQTFSEVDRIIGELSTFIP